MRNPDFGTYGGKVVRALNTDGQKILAGTELDPETTSAWPLRNRDALAKAGKVQFYDKPRAGEELMS